MDEVQQQSEMSQVAPEVTSHEEPKHEIQVESEAAKRQENNWKAMRKRQDDLERELRKKDEMLEKMLNMQISQVAQKPIEIDELDKVSDDEFIPKGQQKKFVRREVEPLQKKVEELEKQLQHQKQSQFMDGLKRQYSDFDEIVNADTLALLEEQEPELATTIADLKDPYKIGVQSYKFIKALNLSKKAPEVRRSKEVDQKLEQNAKTVQSPQVYDKRPMAQAFRMTKEEQSKLYQEMTGYARYASSVPELS